MPKRKGMNKHQKAVYKEGEKHVSREQMTEMIAMARSTDPEERLIAALYLCPCHIQGRPSEAQEAIYRLMQDEDWRVRRQAWHTFEDGGLPREAEPLSRMETIFRSETHPKVKSFAETILGKELAARRAREEAELHLATRPPVRKRGKCDFCGTDNLPVDFQLETTIPDGANHRPALICDTCAINY
jgi:hypothetical protein